MRKLLAAILVICMLSAMLPAISADGENGNDSGITVKYDFTVVSGGVGVYTLANTANLFASTTNTCTANTYDGTFRIQSKSSGDRWAVFTIYVPQAGDYNVSLDWLSLNGASSTEVHIFERPAGANLTNLCRDQNSPIKTMQASAATTRTEESIGNISLKKGNYLLMFKMKASSNAGWFTPYSLTLSSGNGSVATAVLMAAEKTEVEVAETATMSASVHMSDGAVKSDLTGYNVNWTTSNGNVAVVDSNGVVTGVAEGKADITVTIENGDISLSSTIAVVVKSKNASDVRAVYNLAQYTGGEAFENYTYDRTGDFWAYVDNAWGRSASASSGDLRSYGGTIRLKPSGNADMWYAVEINVPKAGEYDFSLNWQALNGPAEADIFLFKKIEGEPFAETFKKATAEGTVSASAAQTAATDKRISSVTLENAPYYVVFNVRKGKSGWFVPYKIILNGGDGAVPMSLSISAESSEVFVGNKNALKCSLVMSDGTVSTDIMGYVISYKSSDENVVTVDSNGRLLGNKVGNVRITAMGTKDGAPQLSGYKDISVKVPFASEIVEKYDLKKYTSGDPLTNLNYDTCGNWKYYNNDFGASAAYSSSGDMRTYSNAVRFKTSAASDKYYAIVLKVPKDGIYEISLNWEALNGGANAKVYMFSTEENFATSLKSENLLGEVDAAVARAATDDRFGLKYLNEGEYYFVYKVTRAEIGWFVPYGITLDGINCLRYIDFSEEEYTVTYGNTVQIEAVPKKTDGTPLETDEYIISYKSLTEKLASVDPETGLVTGKGNGFCKIEVTAKEKNGTAVVTDTVTVRVIDDTGIKTADLSVSDILYTRENARFRVNILMNSGYEFELDPDQVKFTSEPSGILTYNAETGMLKVSDKHTVETKVKLTAGFTLNGEEKTVEKTVTVKLHEGKTKPTYYTEEMRANARENIEKYDWAKKEKETAVEEADEIINNFDYYYGRITPEGLPRGRAAGDFADPEYRNCRYCGVNIAAKYNSAAASAQHGFTSNEKMRSWKVQCQECKRLFPSNDFALLYERGIDKQGYYDVERARANNAIAVANGEKDALVNELYPELIEGEKANIDPVKGVWVDGKTWGVDDGWGYRPKNKDGSYRTYPNGTQEKHLYISLMNYGRWSNFAEYAQKLANAYIYTGDPKYGRAGAIFLDRIADVLPSMDMHQYLEFPNNGYAGSFSAMTTLINDCWHMQKFLASADAFYPMLEDPEVINFLSQKAKDLELKNDKSSSMKIWQNWEDNMVAYSFEMAKKGKFYGNPGMHQTALAIGAVVLDRQPETNEMLEFCFKNGSKNNSTGVCSGFSMASTITDTYLRDGFAAEAAPTYNFSNNFSSWVSYANTVQDYDCDDKYKLWDNPKFARMAVGPWELLILDEYHPQIGDSGAVASREAMGSVDTLLVALQYLDGTDYAAPIAAYIGKFAKEKELDLHFDIFTENPESAKDLVEKYYNEDLKLESDMLTGYGFAVLRGNGMKYGISRSYLDTRRDWWVYFGLTDGHGHREALNLGIDAYGLNLAPSMGYPESATATAHRLQVVSSTVATNTVVVNNENQISSKANKPLHFDDSGKVKVIDISAPEVYEHHDVEEYRRTVVAVEASDDVEYAVDFFRIIGGNTHTYSFHSQAETAIAAEGLEMTEQKDSEGNWIGSYAGVNAPYINLMGEQAYFTGPGEDPNTIADSYSYPTAFPICHTWMEKVRRDNNPERVFAVDFPVKDYRKTLQNNKDIHLRLTQVNDFVADEVAFVGIPIPNKKTNSMFPKTLDYTLITRKGENLDTLFTSVIEPYKGERYIESIETVPVTVESGELGDKDTVRAVKVTHTSKRVDYIVYATNNSAIYYVEDADFRFSGVVGVYTKNAEGQVIYRYVNDGTLIGEQVLEKSAYKGTITGFQKDLVEKNYIDISVDCVDVSELVNKYIYINNDGAENGVYKILGAQPLENGDVRLDIGTVTAVRAYKDRTNLAEGYTYNIEKGQTFEIPCVFVDAKTPVFDEIKDLTTSAGRSISFKVNAESPIPGNSVYYEAVALPRGASFNSESATITWKPSGSQIGENVVAIRAVDSEGRDATIHFTVMVYGATTGSESSTSGEETKGNSGGGAGGGDGAAPTEKPNGKESVEDTTAIPNDEEAPDASGETDSIRFTDIGNYIWAENAITALASAGIIKGTSENVFSPAANITRADFVLLLVRAFELTSDNAENFADVSAADYFATELAIARNNGIVSGIGYNRFAPRNTITRQDMMTIVYRAMLKLGFELKTDETKSIMDDMSAVSDYAKEAVDALIGAGLVNGKSGLVAPMDYTTRAEVAVLIKRILDYTK